MPTLLLSPHHTVDSRCLWKTAIALGWHVERWVGWKVPASLRTWLALVLSERVFDTDVVTWEGEFRSFILNRTLRTFSAYLRNHPLQNPHNFLHTTDEEQELGAFVYKLLHDDRVLLSKATVIDVGGITEKGWAVVEQNAAWGTGFSGCEPQDVLKVLQSATIRSS